MVRAGPLPALSFYIIPIYENTPSGPDLATGRTSAGHGDPMRAGSLGAR